MRSCSLNYRHPWGVSLDFVPILRAGQLCWKRTSKTAAFDLCIDPIDNRGERQEWCSISGYFPRKTHESSNVTLAVKRSARAARQELERIKSIADVAEFFHQRSNVQFRRFSLENYVQTHLAWGLCLLALGKRKEGEHHLEKYCAQFGVDRNDRVLRQAEKATMRGAPM
jgi:hypothetical protein